MVFKEIYFEKHFLTLWDLDCKNLILNYDSMTDRVWFHTLIGTSCLDTPCTDYKYTLMIKREVVISNNNITDLHLNREKTGLIYSNWLGSFCCNAKHLEHMYQSFFRPPHSHKSPAIQNYNREINIRNPSQTI